MSSQEAAVTQNVRVWGVTNRFRVALVAGFCPLFGLIYHRLIISHILGVTSLNVLTGVVVRLLIIAALQLLEELLLLLKLYLMLLNNRSLRILFDPLDQSKSLPLFHIIDHLQLLLRIPAANLLECIGQRVEIGGTAMISRRNSRLDRGLGSFLIPLDQVKVHLIMRLLATRMVARGVSCSVCTGRQRATLETGTLS